MLVGVSEYFNSCGRVSGGLFEFLGASVVLVRADRACKTTEKVQTYEGVSLDPCLEPPWSDPLNIRLH